MSTQTRQLNALHLRADVTANTYDKSKRTVEVTFATDTPVQRGYGSERYNEILSFEKGHVRLDRLNAGAPVLNSHNRYSLEDQLGVVEKAWIQDGQGRAILRFSEREEVAGFVSDIENGIIKNVSVGYRVYKYEKKVTEDGTPDEMRALDWEPYEISMVTVPADHQSTVRELPIGTNEVQIISTSNTTKNRAMTPEEITAAENQRKLADDKIRKEAAEAAQLAERTRATEITNAVRTANLPVNFAEKLITDGKTVDEARKLIIEEWGKKDPNEGTNGNHRSITVGADERDKKRDAMQNAFEHRVGAIADKDLKAEAREYRGMSLLDMARESLEVAGEKTRGMSQREIAQAALNLRSGSHSTSDFPLILGNTVNRVLRQAYEYAPRTFTPFTRKTTAKDFRAMTRTQLSGLVGNFDQIAENAEYKAGSLTDAAESYSVYKYGKKIIISWEALINDDLAAFTRIPTAIAQKAAQKQSDLVYAIFTANPNMADGKALFHADHGNLTSSGTALSIDSLGVMRKSFRVQKGIENDFLNLAPQHLIVAPEKEQLAYQFTSTQYTPATAGTVNPVSNTNLNVIVEPRLSALASGNSWFGAGNPNMVDTIEYAFLEGEGELFTEQKVGFDVDGLEIKARMVFGCKAIDWRNLYKNVGA